MRPRWVEGRRGKVLRHWYGERGTGERGKKVKPKRVGAGQKDRNWGERGKNKMPQKINYFNKFCNV